MRGSDVCLLRKTRRWFASSFLFGSGPFEARYAAAIRATKNSRMTKEQRTELSELRPKKGDSAQVARFIELSDVAETYARDASPQPYVSFDGEIHATVWPEADDMRKTGALLDAVSAIRCPVVAIHGDYDPRPFEGVQLPLQAALPSADFVRLERCGHKPWQETFAKVDFYSSLETAISRSIELSGHWSSRSECALRPPLRHLASDS